ncbi:MAG TPA: DegT/DnrJ/EryC1/StrS family aminotransferase, partial [Thermoplasmata archaeon]
DLMEKFGFEPQQANPGALRVLARRLQDLESRIKAARRNASVFRTATESAGLEPPFEAPWGQHSYFQFAIRFSTASARDRAMADLAARGVDSIRFYHDSAGLAARRYGYEPGTCPTAEAIAQTVLTVPCHGRLTSDDVETIASALENLGDKP